MRATDTNWRPKQEKETVTRLDYVSMGKSRDIPTAASKMVGGWVGGNGNQATSSLASFDLLAILLGSWKLEGASSVKTASTNPTRVLV